MIHQQYLEQKLFPLGYQLDESQGLPLFWKKVKHEDLRSPYAFSVVLITLHPHIVRIEGLNEPRLRRAIRMGLIEINSEEEVDALKEVIFEGTLDQTQRLEMILPFFEQQLMNIEAHPLDSEPYLKALDNIELLVEAANEVD